MMLHTWGKDVGGRWIPIPWVKDRARHAMQYASLKRLTDFTDFGTLPPVTSSASFGRKFDTAQFSSMKVAR